MTRADFCRLMSSAGDCKKIEEFIGRCVQAVPCPSSDRYEAAETTIEMLRDIWLLHHNFTYAAVVKLSGLSNRAFSAKYGIPIRTAEKWHLGERQLHQWALELLAADVVSELYRI